MNKLLRAISSLYSSHWREALLAVISAIIGIFSDDLIKEIAPPLFDKPNLPYVAFALIAAIFLATASYSMAMWRTTNRQIASIETYTGTLANTIGQRIQVLPYTKGFKELQKRIQSAKSEILVLSNYVFDWENKQPIYDTVTMQSSERKAVFAATQSKLQREKRKGFRYVRIVQIPKGHRLEEALPYDPIYQEDCKFLADTSKSEPEFASLRLSEIIFQNTFCIIDRSFLYLEFDTRKTDTNQTFLPFVMIVEDPNSEVIHDLVKLHQRIEAGSTLITKIG